MRAVTDLPTPSFAFDPDAPGACLAGVRPYRMGSYRLDTERPSGKFVVHNYGHGGAGISMSWGCAARVKDLVRTFLAGSPQTEAAVLGAGVMGLTAATRLLDLGLRVTIYADRLPRDTTSWRAGGQWAVSIMEFAGKEQELKGIVKTAYTTFKQSIGNGYGVSEVPNFSIRRTPGLDTVMDLVPGLLPPREDLPGLPFQNHHDQPGHKYQTLLVEPPIFLARLEHDLRARGVTFVTRRFADKADVLTLTQQIIVNCTGLGAKTLWNDSKLLAVKGQLAMLRPQPNLHYLYGRNGYLFPRADHVVIGGTTEMGVDDEVPSKTVCTGLVRHIAAAFGEAAPVPLPKIHIDHPDNERLVDPRLSITD
ncbi:FAD-dependent oxidoreductase [Nonomuraea antimicrobica]|uniref:FAD-dependent oxidoreductase n=1 Tax=Nonomuraea antimicrobica TaxID=561173 RepID=UPI0031F031FD